jgi:hypothetical protein
MMGIHLHDFCTFLLLIMQPGSLISSSSTPLYRSSPPVMSNFFGTLIAILTFALPITLISQNSASVPSTVLPKSATMLPATAVSPQAITPP